ncbi:hypothetical protein ACVMIH_002237 [Bradyrhizobium sp. USDA 4503]
MSVIRRFPQEQDLSPPITQSSVGQIFPRPASKISIFGAQGRTDRLDHANGVKIGKE